MALGNCQRVSVQAVYTLSGAITPSGANGTHFERIHVVRDGKHWYGPAIGDPAEITTLLDLATRARNGQPYPTRRFRYTVDDRSLTLHELPQSEHQPISFLRR